MPPAPTPTGPAPSLLHPLAGHERLVFLKNSITNPLIEVGDYTYYDDFDDVRNFERNVLYHFPFVGDRLRIGRFCQIASGVKFVMNGGKRSSAKLTTAPTYSPRFLSRSSARAGKMLSTPLPSPARATWWWKTTCGWATMPC